MNAAAVELAVIVTRPAAQSARLVELLEAVGARTIALPGLAIEAVELDAQTVREAEPDRFDWVIYTSANAVAAACARLPLPQRATLAAVGLATQRALESRGLTAIAPAADAMNSEGLLALPPFAAPAGQRILIARGVGGRELLADTLRARGARVHVVELYRRLPVAALDAAALAQLEALQTRPGPVVLALSSVEGLEAVMHVAGGALLGLGARLALVLPGERLAQAARRAGLAGPAILARSAQDAAMVQALLDWRSASVPPADPPAR